MKFSSKNAGALSALATALFVGSAGIIAPSTPAMAVQPEKGSEQYNLLQDYDEFIRYMKIEGASTSCCTLNDGRANFEEEQTDDPAYPYKIKITHMLDGRELDEPVWVKIPASKILSYDDAEAICGPKRDAAEAAGVESSCNVPPFNVFWAFYYATTLPNGKADHNSFHVSSMYCYLPKPSFQ